MSCFIHGYSDECESSNFQEILSYHYENVSTKLTLALFNQLHVRVESVKETVLHLSIFLWIAKQLTRSKNVMSHLALITNRSPFYVPIVLHDFCALALSCLLWKKLTNYNRFIVFHSF